MMTHPLISVIVPCYNSVAYIDRCLNSLINQTYKRLEIICVNDGSTDNTEEIIDNYVMENENIFKVNHEENKGLFHARLTGYSNSNGEYISFVDSDDYVNRDFYRCLIEKAENVGSDITMCRIVHVKDNLKYVHNSYEGYDFPELEGSNVFDEYMKQEGYNFTWHTVWNKIYSRSLWEDSISYLIKQNEHLIMAEDFAFSSVLFNKAKKFASVDYSYYFYVQHANTSTSMSGASLFKFIKNIKDLGTSFNFVEEYFKNTIISEQNWGHFKKWKSLYSRFWYDNILNSNLKKKQKNTLCVELKKIMNIDILENTHPLDHYFYSSTSTWDERYVELSDKLINLNSDSIVSFDIFDTILVRPFYEPSDIFRIVEFNAKKEKLIDFPFYKIRKAAEVTLREKISREITIEEIYAHISSNYHIGVDISDKLKKMEIACEYRFLKPRKSIKNLINMLHYLGKKVIAVSDFYMDEDIISDILAKNDIFLDKIFVSSEYGFTKNDGKIWNCVLTECEVEAFNLFHIGDSWNSDKISAENSGISSWFYARTVDAFMYRISDIPASHFVDILEKQYGNTQQKSRAMEFLGFRCSIALAANRIYDNPYISFSTGDEYGANLNIIGYFVLGTYIFGISKWLLDNHKDSNTIHFISRDGYLPMKAYDILNDGTSAPSNYVYMSRKALMPLRIKNKTDVHCILDDIDPDFTTYSVILKPLSCIIDVDEVISSLGVSGSDIIGKDNYNDLFHAIASVLDDNKINTYRESIKGYFKEIFKKGDEVFDIGYSGRTQIILTKLLSYPIDANYIHTTNGVYCEDLSTLGIKLNTYYNHTPSIMGGIREYILSETAPSCVGYDVTKNGVVPLFESYNPRYCTEYFISTIHRYSLKFIEDIRENFISEIDLMGVRPDDISIPFEILINHSTDGDRHLFTACEFEDDLLRVHASDLVKSWESAISYYRLKPVVNMVYEQDNATDSNKESLLINVDSVDNRLLKGMLYLIFDKTKFKEIIKSRR